MKARWMAQRCSDCDESLIAKDFNVEIEEKNLNQGRELGDYICLDCFNKDN